MASSSAAPSAPCGRRCLRAPVAPGADPGGRRSRGRRTLRAAPRAAPVVLAHRQRNALALEVDLDHAHLDDVAGLHHLVRILDEPVGQLRTRAPGRPGARRCRRRRRRRRRWSPCLPAPCRACRSLRSSTPSAKVAVRNSGRGSRPGFSSSARMSRTVGRPKRSSAKLLGVELAQRGAVAHHRAQIAAAGGDDALERRP